MSDKSNIKIAILLVTAVVAAAFGGHLLIERRLAGTMTIVTIPSGAAVYLDGTFQGTTPITIERVQLGFRHLLVAKEGYDHWDRLVNIDSRERWSLHLVLSDQRIRAVWTRRVAGSLFAPLVLVGERLYVSSVADGLFVLERQTGEIVWQFDPDEMSFTSPLVDEKSVYLLAFDGTARALDRADGSLLWSEELGETIAAGRRAILKGEAIYLASGDGTVLHRVDAFGSEQWALGARERPSHLQSTIQIVALGKATVALYLLQPTGRILLFVPRDGRLITERSLPILPLAVDKYENTIYVIGELHRGTYRLLALCASDLSIVWQSRITARPTIVVAAGKAVAVGTTTGAVQLFDAADGKERWIYQTGEEITAVVVTERKVYAGTARMSLFALEESSGTIHWRVDVGSQVITMIPSPKGLYVATRDGTVRLLSTILPVR